MWGKASCLPLLLQSPGSLLRLRTNRSLRVQGCFFSFLKRGVFRSVKPRARSRAALKPQLLQLAVEPQKGGLPYVQKPAPHPPQPLHLPIPSALLTGSACDQAADAYCADSDVTQPCKTASALTKSKVRRKEKIFPQKTRQQEERYSSSEGGRQAAQKQGSPIRHRSPAGGSDPPSNADSSSSDRADS